MRHVKVISLSDSLIYFQLRNYNLHGNMEKETASFNNKQVRQMLKVSVTNVALYEHSGSFSGGYEYCHLLGCDVM
jgi:hypothetical protein